MAEHDYSITMSDEGLSIVRGGIPLTTRHPVHSADVGATGLGPSRQQTGTIRTSPALCSLPLRPIEP
jgi:hypothetical protein